MRKIKFRGKRIDNGEWIYGYYSVNQINHGIWSKDKNEFPFWYQVHPESVGQWTNEKDINNVDCYEGDVDKDFNVVAWCDKRNGWALSTYDFPTKKFVFCNCYNCEGNYEIDENPIEIIGNIHDTPALINGK